MSKIYVIAEMAYSHDGSTELAKDIISKAKRAKADAISIHFTDMPNYMVPHYGSGPGRVSAGKDTQPIYDYLVEISPTFEAWAQIVSHARAEKLDVVVMPNDHASFRFAETLEPNAYVLSAACFEEYNFITEIGATGRAIYLRVGGATLGEIENVINLLRDSGNKNVTLLYGHQNYPTQISDTNLNYLPLLQQTFGLPVGIADHVNAEDEFSGIAPLLAIPLGITCIEKHITHDRSLRGEDHESALNENELALLVERIRKAEQALGPTNLQGLVEASASYRANVRKRVVAARDIPEGELITADAVICKRADEGMSPSQLSLIVGRHAARNIDVHSGIELDQLAP
ncbi:MAG: hypothetical protein GKS01_05635 [Alphaproteobacteria bacterium]|nr:hypothetical protein [Alphaproteobacteria bacterium]